jgi:hypothetical protein
MTYSHLRLDGLTVMEHHKPRNRRGNMNSMLKSFALEISGTIGISTMGAYLLIGVVLLFVVYMIINRS